MQICRVGTFCHQMLNNVTHWKKGATLEDVIDALAKYLEEPEPLYAVNLGEILNNFNFDLIFNVIIDIAREYLDNREEYIRKARAKAEESAAKS